VALSASAILEGFAVLQQPVLHAYVGSSCGASWGCWGGNTGGLSVCSGSGSSIEADCIGKGGAGIQYGFNGVCHQTANRILSPGGVIVPPRFQQVRTTYFVYGAYGFNLPNQSQNDRWPDRKIACSSPGGGPPSSSTRPGGPSSGSRRFLTFSVGRTNLVNLTEGSGDQPDRRSELLWLLREGLGHPVDDQTLNELAEMQAWLQFQQRELVRLFMNREIGRETYLSRLDVALKTAVGRGETLLGHDDFHKVFGEFRVDNIIDPNIFMPPQLKGSN
jgi:hypothetical protein